MPQENTDHNAVLAAIAKTAALAGMLQPATVSGLSEAELDALTRGHIYAGQRVAPYLRLLTYEPTEEIMREGETGGNCFYFVVDGPAEVYVRRGWAKVGELQAGTLFGEMTVLANLPRTATVCAPKDRPVTVLEVQRPALRLLRKVPLFAVTLDKAYRRNSRALALQDLAGATRLDTEALDKLATSSQFHVYEKQHTLFREGEPIRRLYVIKSGWVKLSKAGEGTVAENAAAHAHGWNAVAHAEYLGAGYCFGLEGVTVELNWPQTATALSRIEVLEISLALLRETPQLIEDINIALKKIAPPAALAHQRQPLPIAAAQDRLISTAVAETANLLTINSQTCIRCGNCSLACHTLHGQTRLVRRGFTLTRPVTLPKEGERASLETLIVPAACHHCHQPECLLGCPTSAIKQLPEGRVEINAQACIGCGDCAARCPYGAIALVPREAERAGERLAIKCDLCVGTDLNANEHTPHLYGCVENCPTGALQRVKPAERFAELSTITSATLNSTRRKRSGAARLLPGTQPNRRLLSLLHGIGMTVTVLLAMLVWWNRQAAAPPLSTGRGWHWLTGWFGLAGLAGVLAYVWRKRNRARRLGLLQYWLLAHNYAGLAMALLFALHCGRSLGSPLTKALAIVSALAFLTGGLGQLLYLLVPRWLTKWEPQPLLLEDLLERRTTLHLRLAAQEATDDERASLPHLNRLIFGQRLLRLWVWPHIAFAGAMLALLAVHLLQVIYFGWR
jgi:Fe-S-cluster-containing dehydrogenase component/CRP-like cAMP-binding protein